MVRMKSGNSARDELKHCGYGEVWPSRSVWVGENAGSNPAVRTLSGHYMAWRRYFNRYFVAYDALDGNIEVRDRPKRLSSVPAGSDQSPAESHKLLL